MSSRASIESKVLAYFEQGSPEKVQLVFGLVKAIVSRRFPKRAVSTKATRKGKVNAQPAANEATAS